MSIESNSRERVVETAPARPHLLSTVAFLLSAVASTLGVLFASEQATLAAIVLMVTFLALELRRVPLGAASMAATLAGIGFFLSWYAGRLESSLYAAGKGGLLFLVLFGAVAFIQYPALRSPAMQQASTVIMRQPPGRRYLAISTAAHFLGALINFAALSLLATFLKQPMEPGTRRRMAAAMSRGFAIAASWSPFFVSMAVILSVMDELSWLVIAIPGVPMGIVMLAYGWFYDRVGRRGSRPAPPPAARQKVDRNAFVRLTILACVLVALVIGVAESRQMPMPVAIFLVVPLFSLLWQLAIDRGAAAPARSVRGLFRHSLESLPALRAEVLLFLAANVLGQGVASVFDAASVEAAMRAASLTGTLAICVILAAMMSFTVFGVHPLVLIVVVGHVLPVERLDIAPVSLALIMATVWGLGVVVSPVSGLTLFMARTLQLPHWRVAWINNGRYALIGTMVSAAYIVLYNSLVT